MEINLFDVDKFCEKLQPIKTNKIYSKKGFHLDGLFSEKIFGPERSCTCPCGIYFGRSKVGTECSCEHRSVIRYKSARRRTFAKIELPFPVINPIMINLLNKVGKLTFSKIVNDLVYDDAVAGYYRKDDKYVKVLVPVVENDLSEDNESEEAETEAETEEQTVHELYDLPDGVVFHSGSKGVFDIVKYECENRKDDSDDWKFIHDNIDKFWMNNIIVCPPEYRPVSKTKDTQMRDKMNEFYITILNYSTLVKPDMSTYDGTEIGHISFKNLQTHVNNYYEYIFSKFSKKSGLIRGSILGKRIDFSARAVISPDPTLELTQASVPYIILLELFKMNIANRLLEKKTFNDRIFVRYDDVLDFIEDCIKFKNYCLYEVVEEVTKDRMVVLNRQPTLHRMGFLSFMIKPNNDNVIKIHPLVCEPYNADFDGDQMAAYISVYDETEKENKEKFFILENMVSPSTGKLVLGFNQDILLGIYLLTKETDEKIVYDGIETYKGRVEFNRHLPENFPFINKTIDKKQLNILVNIIAKSYSAEECRKIFDDIKKLGFKETTLRGTTFSLKNLHMKGSYEEISSIVDDESLSLRDKFFKLQNSEIKNKIRESFPYADFINSGSRGSWDQADQLLAWRGFISNSKGQIVPTPIKNNLVNGLTKDEFFISCYGSRKALLDVALNTAVSGYLTRKLVYATVNLELDEDCDDCGTHDCLEIKIPEYLTSADIEERVKHIENEKEREIAKMEIKSKIEQMNPVKFSKSLIGRYVQIPDSSTEFFVVTEDNYLDLCGNHVRVRSPIYCKNTHVCKTCYGKTSDICHSKYIGVIAAQALGEVATQLTLRTFHVGGVAQMREGGDNDDQQDIINDLAVVQKILHAKDSDVAEKMLMKLFSIYSHHRILLLVHFESVISQMMRVGDNRWRTSPDRDNTDYDVISIENVPVKESFLLALAFSKPHEHIVNGILGENNETDGILEKILTNNV